MYTSALIGSSFGPFLLVEELGEGAASVVFRARHTRDGTDHAVKLLHTPAPDLRERLHMEGEVLSRLVHPNVIRVTHRLRWEGGPILVMEFIDGPTLEQASADEPMAIRSLDRLARGLMAGLEAVHDAGYVHRDLTPSNVLLRQRGRQLVPIIADFGLLMERVRRSPTSTRDGVALGTPAYMAPEQVQDAATVDHRADLWALGAILYELATGEGPFTRSTGFQTMQAVVDEELPDPRAFRPDLPQRVVDALHACLQKNPRKRPVSVEAVRRRWEGITKPTWGRNGATQSAVIKARTVQRSSGWTRKTQPASSSGRTHLHALLRNPAA
jgi:serine/threonine-protein kinase